MKLEIPKPISEVDVTHVEIASATRHPDYTNSEYSHSDTIANLEFRRVILEDCRVERVIPGATVVHKKIAKDRRTEILTWGIVIAYVSPLSQSATWRPVRIKWLSGSFEDCHATDLIIMNYVPDKGTLQKRALSDVNPSPL